MVMRIYIDVNSIINRESIIMSQKDECSVIGSNFGGFDMGVYEIIDCKPVKTYLH